MQSLPVDNNNPGAVPKNWQIAEIRNRYSLGKLTTIEVLPKAPEFRDFFPQLIVPMLLALSIVSVLNVFVNCQNHMHTR